jgi:hypothetical protein
MDFVNFLFLRGDIDKSQLEEVRLNSKRDHRKSADVIVNKGFLSKKEILQRLTEYSEKEK